MEPQGYSLDANTQIRMAKMPGRFLVPYAETVELGDRDISVPAGFYILHEAPDGLVSLYVFETESESRMQFRVHDYAYTLWLER